VVLHQTPAPFFLETAWSPSGEWICHNGGNALHLVSPDGKTHRLLSNRGSPDFGFSKDGAIVYVLRRDETRKWEVAAVNVKTGAETRMGQLGFLPSAELSGFSLHANGKSFITSIGTSQYDIWLMEGFRIPAGLIQRLWHAAKR